jgi:hypothetical protein
VRHAVTGPTWDGAAAPVRPAGTVRRAC